jgi:hypothetical protein
MGTWVRDIVLDPGETLVWRVGVNWMHQGIAAGGHLALTSTSLVFQPNRVDSSWTGPWRLPLTAVARVGVQPVTWRHVFSGGLRRRMRLELVDGSIALLVINRLDRRVQEIGAAVDAARRAG